MRQTTGTRKSPGEKIVKDIKRATRKHYSSEEKIRIVLDGLVLSRLRSGLPTHLGSLSFEGQGTFAT